MEPSAGADLAVESGSLTSVSSSDPVNLPSEERELAQRPIPAWLRETQGESRIPVTLTIAVAIALQVLLPNHLSPGPRWLIPGLATVLFITVTAANPIRMTREHPLLRAASLILIALMSIANSVSAALLIRGILTGTAERKPAALLGTGAAIYLTNIAIFAMWYWEFDRGGPFARAGARRKHPDFLFPQMQSEWAAHPDWEPYFLDYLYVSFTNAAAFSPTDTMPLSRWAKMLMLVQSAVALLTIGLVIARAVNILK
ncbi:MAG TPA: hypothetical protein VMU77_02820 [Acidimicrobiales bacterium]|nr:hypothetical protein [Acidimicrobiales bacterium]